MPTTTHADALPLLNELLLFCAIAGVLIPLVRRLHFSRVLAFLIVGAAVGPCGFGGLVSATSPWRFFTIPNLDGARAIAEFGIVFLLFTLGLELSAARLWSLRRWVFGLGNLQILATAVPLGGLAWWFGNAPPIALVLGLALALSSTAIVMQLLAEHHQLGTPMGRAAQMHDAGAPVYHGDAEHPDLLASAALEEALAVAITLDDPIAAARIAAHLHRRAPAVAVLARARP